MATALSVRTEYFFRPAQVTLGEVEYRKKASASAKLLKKIESDVVDQAERWLSLKNVWPNFPIASFNYHPDVPVVSTLDAVEQVAAKVRTDWRVFTASLCNIIRHPFF